MISAVRLHINLPRVMRADPITPGRRKNDGFSLNVRFCYGWFDKQAPWKIHNACSHSLCRLGIGSCRTAVLHPESIKHR
jgi:hypothetical protein